MASNPTNPQPVASTGMMHLKLGNQTQASKYLEQALVMELERYPGNNSEIAKRYNDFACLLFALSKFEEAGKHFELALQFAEKQLPSHDPILASYRANLAANYTSLEKYSEAIELFQIAVESQNIGHNDPSVANQYQQMGIACSRSQKYNKAIWSFETSINILENIYGRYHRLIASIYSDMADVYNQQKMHAETVENYRIAFVIMESSLGFEDARTQTAKQNWHNAQKAKQDAINVEMLKHDTGSA